MAHPTGRRRESMSKLFAAIPRGIALIALVVFALALTGGAGAEGDEEAPPAASTSTRNVEVIVGSKADIDRLIADGFDLAEYVNPNQDGSITVNVIGTDEDFAAIQAMGFTLGETIEDESTGAARMLE